MTAQNLARIELEARQARAKVLSGMIRNLVRRISGAPIATARTA